MSSTSESVSVSVSASSSVSNLNLYSGPGVFVSRAIAHRIESIEQSEGDGVRVRRSIGGHQLRHLDPFLLLDEAYTSPSSGFPDHPHRGFETVSYVLPDSKGWIEHEDSEGSHGTLRAGDLQWMTAGRGILHAEMPGNQEIGHGLQLWVNLPANEKLRKPRYQELSASKVPKTKVNGVDVAVIAGESLGIKSPIKNITPVHYLHVTMDPHSSLEQPIESGWNSFIYTLSGSVMIGGKNSLSLCRPHYTITLTNDKSSNGVSLFTGEQPASFVLLAGKPIGEPIEQHGPFVMNTREEIMQAFRDFQEGKNGFESTRGWVSKIGRRR